MKAQPARFEFERLIRRSNLPPPARLIALTIATWTDAAGIVPVKFTPSLTTLAKATGLGRSTVAAQLNTLETEGWIVRSPPSTRQALQQHHRTQYRISTTSPAAGLVPDEDQSGPRTGLTPVPLSDASGSPAAGHKPDHESSLQDLVLCQHGKPARSCLVCLRDQEAAS